MNNQLINFHLCLIVVLGCSYLTHDFLYNSTHLLLLYVLNFSIAVFVYWLVYLLRNSQKEYLGFYFLAGTFIKFISFFLFVLPIFKYDNFVSTSEFLSFFVPYTISLIVEKDSIPDELSVIAHSQDDVIQAIAHMCACMAIHRCTRTHALV